jgi:hypothetical protein
MAENTGFKITSTQPFTYVDDNGVVVNGYRVFLNLTKQNEAHFILVRSLDPGVVKAAVELLVKNRDALANL